METGKIIKTLRIEKGLTQTQLGDILGVQKSAIAKYESGIVENLKPLTIRKMAEYFDVSPLLFLGYDNPDEEKEIDLVYQLMARYNIDVAYRPLIQTYLESSDDTKKAIYKFVVDLSNNLRKVDE